MLKKLVLTSIITFILISCATSSLGRKQLTMVPAEEMDAMGAEAFEQLKEKTPIEGNRRTNSYVKCVADAIIEVSESQIPIDKWEVVVFRDETANAFALPGGKIGVHTGLLNVAKNQDQLAAVIGHEVGHVRENHSNERVSQASLLEQGLSLVQIVSDPQSQMGQQLMKLLGLGSQYGIIMPYSRKHESEADEVGLYLMAKAGFKPEESVTLWENMSQSGGEEP
ncbi:MAG: M48 family peptidase, partial [Candidatus Parabeggiatoa sp. nov. 1]